jgi:hypothetical protein
MRIHLIAHLRSCASLRQELGGEIRFGRTPSRHLHKNAASRVAGEESWTSLSLSGNAPTMAMSRVGGTMRLDMGVDGVSSTREFGKDAWFQVMGPLIDGFKGLGPHPHSPLRAHQLCLCSLRQGVDFGSPMARQAMLPKGTAALTRSPALI